ncbi:MAG: cupin domain-containing protein [Patescibacteria group bacterium]|nr:cupin domain-containing protein [Patescibacteria group bacterium]
MKGYKVNVEKETLKNINFRKVLYTGKNIQLVLMSLKPGEEIGAEVHEEHDQFFRFDAGKGVVYINDSQYEVEDGDAVIVPSGADHNVINTSDSEELKLYTLYSPPEHRDGVIHANKEEAEADNEHFDGKTSELD